MIISVNLSDEDAEWIKVYAERNNISSSKLIRNIVLEKIENEYDIECYKKVIKEYNENPQTYTLEDVKEELGLLWKNYSTGFRGRAQERYMANSKKIVYNKNL